MELEPLARAALGDAVAGILRNAILGGSLKPGQPLHENALARQLSVSRTPIREALMLLERKRLVVARLNRPPQAIPGREHADLYDPIRARRSCRTLGR